MSINNEISVIVKAHALLAKFVAEDPTQENLDILVGFGKSVKTACIIWLEPFFNAISAIAIVEGLRTGIVKHSDVRDMLLDMSR